MAKVKDYHSQTNHGGFPLGLTGAATMHKHQVINQMAMMPL